MRFPCFLLAWMLVAIASAQNDSSLPSWAEKAITGLKESNLLVGHGMMCGGRPSDRYIAAVATHAAWVNVLGTIDEAERTAGEANRVSVEFSDRSKVAIAHSANLLALIAELSIELNKLGANTPFMLREARRFRTRYESVVLKRFDGKSEVPKWSL